MQARISRQPPLSASPMSYYMLPTAYEIEQSFSSAVGFIGDVPHYKPPEATLQELPSCFRHTHTPSQFFSSG